MRPNSLCQLDDPIRAHNLTQTLLDGLCQLHDRNWAHNLTQTVSVGRR